MVQLLLVVVSLLYGNEPVNCLPGKLDSLFEDGSYTVTESDSAIVCSQDSESMWIVSDVTVYSNGQYTVRQFSYVYGLPYPESRIDTRLAGNLTAYPTYSGVIAPQ